MLAHAALTLRALGLAAGFCAACLIGSAKADDPPATPDSLAPLLAESLTPILRDWIVQSRDAAVAQGVERIPGAIRAALQGYVPDDILDRVRWRVGGAGEMSLQQNLFRFGYAPAVTLDHVVVFERESDALNDPKLWAHELKHVMQYAEWGVTDFAARYLRNYEAVEKEAAEYRWEWMKRTDRVPKVAEAQ